MLQVKLRRFNKPDDEVVVLVITDTATVEALQAQAIAVFVPEQQKGRLPESFEMGLELPDTVRERNMSQAHLQHLPNFIKEAGDTGNQIEVVSQKRFVKDILRSWRDTIGSFSGKSSRSNNSGNPLMVLDPVFVLISTSEKKRAQEKPGRPRSPSTASSKNKAQSPSSRSFDKSPRRQISSPSKNQIHQTTPRRPTHIEVPKDFPLRAVLSPSKIDDVLSLAATPNSKLFALSNSPKASAPPHNPIQEGHTTAIRISNALSTRRGGHEILNKALVSPRQQSIGPLSNASLTAAGASNFRKSFGNSSFLGIGGSLEGSYSAAARARRIAATSYKALRELVREEVLFYRNLFTNNASNLVTRGMKTKIGISDNTSLILESSATLPLWLATVHFAHYPTSPPISNDSVFAPTALELLGETFSMRTVTQQKLITMGYRRREVKRLRAIQDKRNQVVMSEGARRRWAMLRRLFWEQVATRRPDFIEDVLEDDNVQHPGHKRASLSAPSASQQTRIGVIKMGNDQQLLLPADEPLPIPLSIRQQNTLLQRECNVFRSKWMVLAVDRRDGNNSIETRSGEEKCLVCDRSPASHQFVLEPLPVYLGRAVKTVVTSARLNTTNNVPKIDSRMADNGSPPANNAVPIAAAAPVTSKDTWQRTLKDEGAQEANSVADILNRLKAHEKFAKAIKREAASQSGAPQSGNTPTMAGSSLSSPRSRTLHTSITAPSVSPVRHNDTSCAFGKSSFVSSDEDHRHNLSRPLGFIHRGAALSHHHRPCKSFLPKWDQNSVCQHCYCLQEAHTYIAEDRATIARKVAEERSAKTHMRQMRLKLYGSSMPWGIVLPFLELEGLLVCARVNRFFRAVSQPLLHSTLRQVITYQPSLWRAAVVDRATEISKSLANPTLHLTDIPATHRLFRHLDMAETFNLRLASSLQDLLSQGSLVITHRQHLHSEDGGPATALGGSSGHSLSQRVARLAQSLKAEDLTNENVALLKQTTAELNLMRAEIEGIPQHDSSSFGLTTKAKGPLGTLSEGSQLLPKVVEGVDESNVNAIRKKMEILRQSRLRTAQTAPAAGTSVDDQDHNNLQLAFINPSLKLFFDFLCLIVKIGNMRSFARLYLNKAEEWKRDEF